MRIAFDHQVFFFQEYGGISRYYSKLAGSLNSIDGVEARIFAPLHINAYLAELPAGIVKGIDVRQRRKSKKLFRAINNAVSKVQLGLYRPSVVHETYYSKKSVAPRGVPLVVTVYDMIHERFSEKFPQKDRTSTLKRIAVERADHVICISDSTRNDLLDYFQIPDEKASVVHIGFEAFRTQEESGPLQMGGRPHFLYVGQRSVYKNFQSFIRAFAASPGLKRNYNVVCFGGGGFSEEERKIFAALKLAESQVIQTGGDDDALARCYKDAFAFVYPSLYEGFGIPPLEAMSLDCPVICSDTSSIPEVTGQAAEYFDPASIDSIREGLERVAGSSSRRNELVSLGRERYPMFTWPKCAKETLAIYEKLI
ncbi:MAG: glycosyltransferase family 4 protein [Thiobacillaceae bacterium]|jgi:glycosyltransferase involved in cell wall biosynthesis|nr:glycosyltransferase family 4 protein [Thiobacillaceae bacterium]